MQLPVRALVLLALLATGAAFCSPALSQTQSANKQTASVSGKVTIKGKAAAGIVVGMRLSRHAENPSTYKAKTDQDGVYHITKVAAGSYLVSAMAPALVDSTGNPQGQSVIVGEGENIDGLNFDLIPGGVISGKIVDADGRPQIEVRVTLIPADDATRIQSVGKSTTTDDRGDYRIFGLPAGRYKVSVGDPHNFDSNQRRVPVQTFYPNAIDAAKAGIVEVTEGSETNKIDITLGEAPPGYSVTGRVIDGESGAPLSNVAVMLDRIETIDGSGGRNYGQHLSAQSDAQGQFRLSNVPAGKYDARISPPEDSDFRIDAPVRFDVSDQDVNDLVIKGTRGATIAGTVVFEGGKNKQTPPQMWIMVFIHSEEANRGSSSSRGVRVKPDGTFFAGGLTAGAATFNFQAGMGNVNEGFTLSRVERNGVLQPNGIQISNGEHISGVRLVFTLSTGAIRGVVRIENGTLPPNARMYVQIIKEGDPSPPFAHTTEADARGHFLFEGLTAGNYNLLVVAYAPEGPRRPLPTSTNQAVTVTDGGVAEVTLTLDLTPRPPNQ